MTRRLAPWVLALLATALLTACATRPPALTPDEQARLAALLPADVLLLGEQHDAPAHQRLQRQTVEWLIDRGELAALALEMAEQGHDTARLPPNASERQVRQALAWQAAGWPWKNYGPVVMAAVRAGVPVLGANLPRQRMRAAMADAALDEKLPPAALTEQQRRMRDGHCGLLPEAQIAPMTRVQIARDIAMADTLRHARQTGRTVLLIAGNGHVHRALGVPVHLPGDLRFKVISAQAGSTPAAADSVTKGADLIWPTPPAPSRDHCAELRRQWSATRPAPTQ